NDIAVAMRSLHDLNAVAGLRGEARRVARDHADSLAADEDAFEDLTADIAGGRGDDDHSTYLARLRGRICGLAAVEIGDRAKTIYAAKSIISSRSSRRLMDPLSDVLSLLKPRSYVSAGFDAGGDWSIQFSNLRHFIKCYAVVSGQCWMSVEGVAGALR